MRKLPQYSFNEGFYIWFDVNSKEEYYSTPLYMYKTDFNDDLENYKRKIIQEKDFYKNIPHMKKKKKALGTGRHKICYNGDLTSEEDVRNLSEQFPEVESIMIGRGVLADPAIARKIKGGDGADKAEMRHFHDMLYEAYCEEMSGERTVLYKMKELWFYLASSFTNSRPYAKKIKKAEKCAVYEKIIEELFANEEVI